MRKTETNITGDWAPANRTTARPPPSPLFPSRLRERDGGSPLLEVADDLVARGDDGLRPRDAQALGHVRPADERVLHVDDEQRVRDADVGQLLLRDALAEEQPRLSLPGAAVQRVVLPAVLRRRGGLGRQLERPPPPLPHLLRANQRPSVEPPHVVVNLPRAQHLLRGRLGRQVERHALHVQARLEDLLRLLVFVLDHPLAILLVHVPLQRGEDRPKILELKDHLRA